MFGHGAFYGIGGPFIMIILWVAIIVGLVYLVRIMPWGRLCSTSVRESTALEILQRRYAAGELDRDEYERIKNELAH